MPQPLSSTTVIRFGSFDVDPSNAELRKNGVRLHIQEQPMQVLTLLVQRSNEVVTRDELRALLWPEGTFVDYERGLNAAVARLRQVLNDSAEAPRYIETVARRGYRFIAPVQVMAGNSAGHALQNGNSGGAATVTRADDVTTSRAVWQRSVVLRVIGSLVVLAVSAIVVWFRVRPAAPLQVTGYRQLTHDSRSKAFTINALPVLVSDGSRVYFTEGGAGPARSALHQVSVTGGETTPIPTAIQENLEIGDLSPDGLRLSLHSFALPQTEMPLWTLPVTGGAAVPISGMLGRDVTWSPDGRRIAFAKGMELFIASASGNDTRRVVSADRPVRWPRWGPTGTNIRYSLGEPLGVMTIQEVDPGSGKVRPVVPQLTGACCCGNWTPNRKHYVFECHDSDRSNLWAIREKKRWESGAAEAVQLTRGPIDFRSVVPDPNGGRLYALGVEKRGQLLRYDEPSRQFVPYLGGLSADDVASSRDGVHIAWVSYPDGALWRAKSDGSDRRPLTPSGMRAFLPNWSPDGRRIAFAGRVEGDLSAVYLISADGGRVERLLKEDLHQADPSWSPDGKFIAFGRLPWMEKNPHIGITVVSSDGKNPRVLPGSERMYSPHWSPDGRFLQAFTDTGSIVLFDFKTQQWQDIGGGPAAYPNWSRDGKYIYFSQPYVGTPRLARIRVEDKKLEVLAQIDPQQLGWSIVGKWTGLAPDGSALVLRDTGIQEIYALDLREP